MMESDIVIVTAFFDCGRGESFYQTRTNNLYLEYFDFWARIQNKLIVYTSNQFTTSILNIRKRYNLQNNTKIIKIENIWEIEQDIYNKMKEVEAKSQFSKWRYRNNDISNNAQYDYLMLIKYWCMQDAVRRKMADSLVAWLDFGWNHGGQVFTAQEEFEFTWKYPFENKIHLFSLKDPDYDTGVIKLQTMSDSIMGSPIICPSDMCGELYYFCKCAMWSLLSLDCYDDDQMLLRMAYKLHKDKFCIHLSDWFLPMKEYGGAHLSVRKSTSPNLIPIWRKIKNRNNKFLRGFSKERYLFFRRLYELFEEDSKI